MFLCQALLQKAKYKLKTKAVGDHMALDLTFCRTYRLKTQNSWKSNRLLVVTELQKH